MAPQPRPLAGSTAAPSLPMTSEPPSSTAPRPIPPWRFFPEDRRRAVFAVRPNVIPDASVPRAAPAKDRAPRALSRTAPFFSGWPAAAPDARRAARTRPYWIHT